MDKRIAKSNLRDIQNILNRHEIINFLVYGTCLGIIRDGDIFEHDLDTDTGILAEQWNYSVLGDLITARFRILSIFGMFRYGCEIALARNGVKTDIMFYYKDGDKRWNALWQNGCQNGESDMIKHVYNSDIFNEFIPMKFQDCDTEFLVFKKFEDYLIRVYGTDWRIPIKKWDWRCDHKCIEK